MVYGITGNPTKESLWAPLSALVHRLHDDGLDYWIHEPLAAGLKERDLVDPALCRRHAVENIVAAGDLVLSFGGDGTLLRSAHLTGPNDTPCSASTSAAWASWPTSRSSTSTTPLMPWKQGGTG